MDIKREFKRIDFKVDAPMHNELKARAAKRNISMNLYIIRALYRAMTTEDIQQNK